MPYSFKKYYILTPASYKMTYYDIYPSWLGLLWGHEISAFSVHKAICPMGC